MSGLHIHKNGTPEVIESSDGRLTLSVPIQFKRRAGRKLITLPNGEVDEPRPWGIAPTALQLALARGHRWLAIIVDAFKEMYDADVSATLISKVTDRVLEQVTAWQSRPLDTVYPIVYLDCIVLKIREGMRVVNKAIYLALGVNMDGHKDLLGLWMSENEGAKFWVSVLTELKNRGVKDILIACVDGLKCFPDAIAVEYVCRLNLAIPRIGIKS